MAAMAGTGSSGPVVGARRRAGWMGAAALAAALVSGGDAFAESFEAEASTIALPDGPGSIMGMGETFEVSPGTGLATYGIPVPELPSPGGVGHGLTIGYTSGSGNGAMGVGWSLGVARICRSTDAGVPRYGDAADGDLFVFEGGGGTQVLVPLGDAGGWWGPRTEGSWVRARPLGAREGDGQGWEVRHPDGSRSVFGLTAASRSGVDAGGFGGTFCWGLTEREDVFGRRVAYRYLRDGGRLHLSEVRYAEETGHPRVVRLGYEGREDVFADWRGGFERTHALLLTRLELGVEVSAHTGTSRVLRTMTFGYETVGNASRLVRVEMEGEDGLAIPPTTFRYADFEAGRVPELEEVEGPRVSPMEGGHRLVDLTGDGRPDLLRVEGPGRWSWLRNDGAFGFASAPLPVVGAPALGQRGDWQFVDVDGSGRRDILSRRSDGSLEVRWNVTTAGGAVAFSEPEPLGLRIPVRLDSPSLHIGDLNGDRRPDFLWSAGGGLWRAVSSVERDAAGWVRADAPIHWSSPEPVGASGSSGVEGLEQVDLGARGVSLVDMNGDGVPDLVRVLGGGGRFAGVVVHDGRGDGSFGAGRRLADWEGVLAAEDPDTLRFADLDGSGLADVHVEGRGEVRYWRNIGGQRLDGPYRIALPERSAEGRLMALDLRGRGALDFVVVDPRAAAGWVRVDGLGPATAGLLVEAENGMGGVYRITYTTLDALEQEARRQGTVWDEWSPQPMTVVAAIERDDRRGHVQRTEYTFRDPVFSADGGRFETFASATVRQVGDERAQTRMSDHVFFRGDGTDPTGFGGLLVGEGMGRLPEGVDGLAGHGRAVVHRDEAGLMLRQEATRVAVARLPDGRPMVLVTGELRDEAEGLALAPAPGRWLGEGSWPGVTPRAPRDGEELRRLTLVEFAHDGWGNVVREVRWGHVDRHGRPLGDDAVVVEREYAMNEDAWVFGGVASERLLDGAGRLQSHARTFYDGPAFEGLPLGGISRGLVSRRDMWLEEEQRWIAESRHAYDDAGNELARLDALGHRVEFEWDSALGMFPVVERIRLDVGEGAVHRTPGAPAVLEVHASYDLDLGLMTSLRDFNGEETRLVWDGLGRLTARYLPGDVEGEPSEQHGYVFRAPASWVETRTLEDSATGRRRTSRTYVDGFGREITQVSMHGEWGSGRWVASGWLGLGRMGEPEAEFLAFEVDSPEVPAGPPKDIAFRTLFRDALGRVVETRFEDGAREQQHFGAGMVEVLDPNRMDPTSPFHGLGELRVMDGHGRLVLQRHRLGPGGASDWRDYRFGYTASGAMAWRELPDGVRTWWRTDSLGRLVEATDANAGVHRRFHDDAGRVIASEDAGGGLVLERHDAAGRLVEVSLQEVGEAERVVARYAYDVAQEGLPGNMLRGRLAARYEDGFDSFFDFDRRGNRSRVFRRFDGRMYVTGASWDPMGRALAHHYADGTSLALRYDAGGQLRQFGEVVTRVEYTEEGFLARMVLGNGLEHSIERDLRMRPTRTTVGRPGERPLMDIGQRFDAAGVPVETIDHAIPAGPLSQSAQFTLDALYRPVAVDAAALGTTLRYGYSAGNSLVSRTLDGEPLSGARTSGLGSGVFEMGGIGADGREVGPHQVSRHGERRFAYDVSGRRVQDERPGGTQELRWDAAGRLLAVHRPDGTVVSFVYGGGPSRQVRRVIDSDGVVLEERVTLDSMHELRRTAGGSTQLLKRVMVGSQQVAEIRVDGDPGVPEAAFVAPTVAPWAGAFGATTVLRSPGSGRPLGSGGGARGGPVGMLPGASRRALRAFRAVGRSSDGRPWLPVAFGGIVLLVVVGPGGRARRVVIARASMGAGMLTVAGGLVVASCAGDVVLDEGVSPADAHGSGDASGPDVTQNGTITYLHALPMGTVAMRTDAAGRVVMRSHHTPFGVETANEQWGETPIDAIFAGGEVDAETGYVELGARWYDPSVGQFLSPDPLALWQGQMDWGDLNLMAYVGNRPHFMVDPTGYSGVAGTPVDIAMVALGPYTIGPVTAAVQPVRYASALGGESATLEERHRALAETTMSPIPGDPGRLAERQVQANLNFQMDVTASHLRNHINEVVKPAIQTLEMRLEMEYAAHASTITTSEDLAALRQEFSQQHRDGLRRIARDAFQTGVDKIMERNTNQRDMINELTNSRARSEGGSPLQDVGHRITSATTDTTGFQHRLDVVDVQILGAQ